MFGAGWICEPYVATQVVRACGSLSCGERATIGTLNEILGRGMHAVIAGVALPDVEGPGALRLRGDLCDTQPQGCRTSDPVPLCAVISPLIVLYRWLNLVTRTLAVSMDSGVVANAVL